MNLSPPALSKPVHALVRGIAVLRYLNAQPEPIGVGQIARDLRINPSTCFNLLRTLTHERLINFDPSTKRYTTGLGLLELSSGLRKLGGQRRVIQPLLSRVANKYGITVMLWELVSPSRVMLVSLAETHTPLRVFMTVGQRLPSLMGAFGRCIAAHLRLPKARVRTMFNELRWQNPPTFEQYWADAQKARGDGYAIDVGNYDRNFTTVAAPIIDMQDVTMVITAIAFSSNLSAAQLRGLAVDIRDAAREVSCALGADQS